MLKGCSWGRLACGNSRYMLTMRDGCNIIPADRKLEIARYSGRSMIAPPQMKLSGYDLVIPDTGLAASDRMNALAERDYGYGIVPGWPAWAKRPCTPITPMATAVYC